ncbi:hypothetical protein LVJ82_12300 [Vitreoscilla massiliensis]|uniref:Uncharacterized protein n=1 Tax=Vitreoscilla massiliensis TaxID=1689272 RepID=A0ABY4E1R8_9NEIS|nr:hypothetical protein [Vitreoscilla massiliensis]UOO88263.1 hypothetical protein LVJ82_12300 [Vitreoscilla massiliensis]
MEEIHCQRGFQLFTFSNLSLIILLVLTFLMFSGYGIGWSRLPYDEWRMPISCWLILLPFSVSIPEVKFSNAVTVKAAKYMLIIYVLTLIYVLFIPKTINALSFLLVYALLFYAIVVYGYVFQSSRYKNTYLIILGFMPLLTVLWLPIESTLLFLFPDELGAKAWIGSFINIRQYDDAILPLLFILYSCLSTTSKAV